MYRIVKCYGNKKLIEIQCKCGRRITVGLRHRHHTECSVCRKARRKKQQATVPRQWWKEPA